MNAFSIIQVNNKRGPYVTLVPSDVGADAAGTAAAAVANLVISGTTSTSLTGYLTGNGSNGPNRVGSHEFVTTAGDRISVVTTNPDGSFDFYWVAPTAFAPASHTHAYSTLTGKPTLGGAAALNVGTTAGTVAAGDDPRLTGGGPITETAIAGTTTLTASAFGRHYVCSGTSADYTVTLPSPATHAGEEIEFRMAAGLTRLVTLDAGAGVLIDGQRSRVMWAGEAARLRSDGAGWAKVAGKTIPMAATAQPAVGSPTSVADSTLTKIALGTVVVQSVSGMVDTAHSRVYAPRGGRWQIEGYVSLSRGGAFAGLLAGVFPAVNTDTPSFGSGLLTNPSNAVQVPTYYNLNNITYAHVQTVQTRTLMEGDYVVLVAYQATGDAMVTRDLAIVLPYLSLSEAPTW